MRPPIIYFIFYCCLFLPFITSCEKQSDIRVLFQEIEVLMPQQPDSALSLLKGVNDISSLSKADQAHYHLLRTEAEDKTYTPHTTDSLIRIAAYYYEAEDDARLKTKAWYYMGRVNQDMKNGLKAQEYYLKALDRGKYLTDYALLGRIYNNVGMLYTYQSVYEKAIPFQKKAFDYLQKTGDSTAQSFVLRDLARNYTMLDMTDSAIAYYEKAMLYADARRRLFIYTELGGLYIDNGKYQKAHDYLRKALLLADRDKLKYPIYMILGELHFHLGQLDSSKVYLEKSLDGLQITTRAAAFHYLSEIACQKKDWKASVVLNRAYQALHDSMHRQTETESLRRVQELYNYHETEEKLSSSLLRIANLKIKLLISTLVGLILLVLVLWIWRILRKRKEYLIEQQIMLNELRTEQDERENRIIQNRETIRFLEQRLGECSDLYDIKEKELLQLRKELLEVENRNLQHSAASRLVRIEAFRNSEIYIRFHNKIEWKPVAEDWESLFLSIESAYTGFAEKLNKALPKISVQERQVCYLVKTDVPPAIMANLLNCSANNISMIRARLYKKAYNKQGTAGDFDRFLHQF